MSYQVASEEGKRTGDFGGEPDEVSHPVIELVVAEGGGGVPEGVVGAHDRGALFEVRLEGALKHVAAVEEQHRAVSRSPQCSNCCNCLMAPPILHFLQLSWEKNLVPKKNN